MAGPPRPRRDRPAIRARDRWILLVLIVVIVLIVVGAKASKRRKQRQQEEDRRRAAEIREPERWVERTAAREA